MIERWSLRGRPCEIRPAGWGWVWVVYTQEGDTPVATGEASTHDEAVEALHLWTIRLQATPELEQAPIRKARSLNGLLKAFLSAFRR